MKKLLVSLIFFLFAQVLVVGSVLGDTAGCIDCHGTHDNCFSCHEFDPDPGAPNPHHLTDYADVGNCEHCHADPRPSSPNWNPATLPGDNGLLSGLNVPTQLACRECHISFSNDSMIVTKFSRTDYETYKDDYTPATAHTIENAELAALGQINNYGICFSCHNVTVFHARPDKFSDSWNYNGDDGDTERCTGDREWHTLDGRGYGNPNPDSWAHFLPGRSSGSISAFNLFKDPGFGYTPIPGYPSWDTGPCDDEHLYATNRTGKSFKRITVPRVPGNGNTTGSVPVFASLCPMTPEGENCPLMAPVLINEGDTQCTTCSVTLNWNAITAPLVAEVGYLVEVDDNSNFSSPTYTSDPDNWITATSFSVTMASDTTYYWRVTARDNDYPTDVSPASAKDSFRLYNYPPLAAPKLEWPPNGYEMEDWTDDHVGWPIGQNPLRWNASSGATEYYCEIWDNWGGDGANSDWTTALSYHVGDVPDWEEYFWHCKAKNATGQQSGWSATWSWFDSYVE